MKPYSGQIFILTGDRETGKSTFCLKLVKRYSRDSLRVTGVICPAVFVGGKKVSFNLLEIESGNEKSLAKLRTTESQGTLTKRWEFKEEVLQWGNEILGSSTPCDLLIIDELGPLEFEQGKGWQNGLSAVDLRQFQMAFVVIRPELLQSAISRWSNANIISLDNYSEEDFSKLEEQIWSELLP